METYIIIRTVSIIIAIITIRFCVKTYARNVFLERELSAVLKERETLFVRHQYIITIPSTSRDWLFQWVTPFHNDENKETKTTKVLANIILESLKKHGFSTFKFKDDAFRAEMEKAGIHNIYIRSRTKRDRHLAALM